MSSPASFLARRRNRIALIAFASVLVLRAALPYGLALAIERGGAGALGVPVSVDDVDLGLLRGAVAVEGLTVAGVGRALRDDGSIEPETALLRLDRAAANLAWLDLLRGRIRLSTLEIAGPVARIEIDERGAPVLPEPAEPAEPEGADDPDAAQREDGAAEPAEPGPKGEPAPEAEAEPAPEAEGRGWRISIEAFEIRDADLRLHDPVADASAVALGFASFSLSELALVDGSISLGGLGLVAPSLEARRDYLFAPPAVDEAPAEPAPEPAAPAPAHRIAHLKLEPVDFTLLTDAGPLDLSFQLEASEVSTARGETFPIDLGLAVADGRLTLKGSAGITPAFFEGRLAWRDLPLPPIALAAEPELAAWIRSCSASGDLAVTLRTERSGDAGASLSAKGDLALRAFHFEDPEEREARVRFDALEVTLDSLLLPLDEPAAPAEVAIGSVRLAKPVVRYALPSPALDALLAGDPGEAEAAPARETAAEPARIRVDRITLSDGDVAFDDRTVEPAYAGRLGSIDATVTDLRLPAGSGQVKLAGRAPGGSPFSLEGRLGDRTELAFELRKLGLSQFNPYAVDASGYRVDQGAASIETTVTGRGDALQVRNALVLHELGLTGVGERILDDVIGVPVDVALALLRDLEGNIKLGIPLTVDADGTRVGIGTVVRDALRAAITGAITSPLKIAGAALSFGRDGLALPPFEMVPGTTVLVPGQEEEIASVVDLAAKRPELAVTVRGQSDPSDRDGLAVRILTEGVVGGDGLPDLEDAGFFARRRVAGELERRARGEAEALDEDDQQLLDRYVEATFVPPERFDALARERAEAARNYLVETQGLPAERVQAQTEVSRGKPGVVLAFGAAEGGP